MVLRDEIDGCLFVFCVPILEGSVWFGVGFEALNVAGKKYSN